MWDLLLSFKGFIARYFKKQLTLLLLPAIATYLSYIRYSPAAAPTTNLQNDLYLGVWESGWLPGMLYGNVLEPGQISAISIFIQYAHLNLGMIRIPRKLSRVVNNSEVQLVQFV